VLKGIFAPLIWKNVEMISFAFLSELSALRLSGSWITWRTGFIEEELYDLPFWSRLCLPNHISAIISRKRFPLSTESCVIFHLCS
jgi:hypothetical protein